jgi:hypothetical protein
MVHPKGGWWQSKTSQHLSKTSNPPLFDLKAVSKPDDLEATVNCFSNTVRFNTFETKIFHNFEVNLL